MTEESICRKCFHSYVCEQFNQHKESNNNKCHFPIDHFVPNTDVVKVVRCKDCVFYYAEDGDCFHPKQEEGWNGEGGECLKMEKTDFCSYGKRRDTNDR
jgi:hypothetical protein